MPDLCVEAGRAPSAHRRRIEIVVCQPSVTWLASRLGEDTASGIRAVAAWDTIGHLTAIVVLGASVTYLQADVGV